jgi:hypothetical protein
MLQVMAIRQLYDEKSHQYWQTLIAHNRDSPKKLWHTFDSILHSSNRSTTAKCSSLSVNEFAKFLNKKIETVRADTATASSLLTASTASSFVDHWSHVPPNEAVKLISKLPNTSCQLDPVPTWIVKEFSSLLAPFITRLFNASLDSGSYPQSSKHAIGLPLLKKENLDGGQAYQQFHFSLQTLERVFLERLQQYLDRGYVFPRYQSVYCKGHTIGDSTTQSVQLFTSGSRS